jgi:hypothetical protein
VTQLLNACTIVNVAAREASRANRLGSSLCFVAIALAHAPSRQEGNDTEEQALSYAWTTG